MKDDEVKKGFEGQAKVINDLISNQKLIVKKVDELEAKLLVKEPPKKEETTKEGEKK